MTRKALAMLIALAVLVTFVPFAVATNDAVSDGKIIFGAAGDEDDGVYDPEDPDIPIKPDDPDDPDDPVIKFLDKLEPMSLYFGHQEVDLINNQTYPSVKSDGVTPDKAGMLVVSSTNGWKVNITISQFRIGVSETIRGFTMDMIPDGGHVLGVGSITPVSPTTPLGGIYANCDAVLIASGDRGVSGANYAADLNVLRNTAHSGEATAILDWTFIAGTP